MSRWKAASLHLAISAFIGLTAFVLLRFVWYPAPYFRAAGAGELVLLLVGVDLSLGPLLTLIVFKSGKKGLKLDLALIGIVQSMALVYGMSVVLRTRPVFLVAAVDRFVLVRAEDLSAHDLAAGREAQFRSLSWIGPLLVSTLMPSDPKERSDLLFSGLAGKDIERFPKYYVNYASQAGKLLKCAKPLAQLHAHDAAVAARIDAWLRGHDRARTNVVWLPITTPKASLTMLMDSRSGQPLGAVAIDPW